MQELRLIAGVVEFDYEHERGQFRIFLVLASCGLQEKLWRKKSIYCVYLVCQLISVITNPAAEEMRC